MKKLWSAGGEIVICFYPIPPHELHKAPQVRLVMDEIAELKVPILFDSGLSTAQYLYGITIHSQ